MEKWELMCELDENRNLRSGSQSDLHQAIQKGADLRVGTQFRHNEHVDTESSSNEIISEFVDFRVTYLLDKQWVAGICNLRMPVVLPDSFGPRESMSFFLYNENAQQAIARLYLDGQTTTGTIGQFPTLKHADMPKYNELDRWDDDTNSPSSNFIYDFDYYRFTVCDRWKEVYANDADGTVTSGSIDDLAKAFGTGAEIKVAIKGLCNDLYQDDDEQIEHEVFVHLGSCYYYTKQKLLLGAAHPVVRVKPSIPLVYKSHGWDFGWLLPRTDGLVSSWLCDPYTLKFSRGQNRHSIRWFVNE